MGLGLFSLVCFVCFLLKKKFFSFLSVEKMPQHINTLFVFLFLFGTISNAKLTLEVPTERNNRALNLDEVTESMPYIRFHSENDCRMVVENWSDAVDGEGNPLGACVFRDHCESSNAIRVMTSDVVCRITVDSRVGGEYNVVAVDFNSLRFENNIFYSESSVGSVYARETEWVLNAGSTPNYECAPQHTCAISNPPHIYYLIMKV